MKKAILLAAAAVMFAVGANAQDTRNEIKKETKNGFRKGDWTLGVQGSGIGFENHFNDGLGGNTRLDAGLFGSWFLTDKLAVDLSAGFSHTRVGNGGTYYNWNGGGVSIHQGGIKSSTFDFGGGVRYYPVGNLFAGVGYHGKTGSGTWAQYLGAKVGYDIFLSKNVFFEPAVYFEKNMKKNFVYNTGRESVLGLSLGFGMRF